MEFSLLLLMGLATGFNFIIIVWKFKKQRWLDALIDACIMAAICVLFSGTVSGLSIGMVGSAMCSVYLLISPPKFSF